MELQDDELQTNGRALWGAAKFANYFLTISGLASIFIAALGTADVFSSFAVGRPIVGVLEVTELALVVLIFMAQPFVVHSDSHIRLDLFSPAPGSLLGRTRLLLTSAAGLLCYGLIAWTGWDAFWDSYAIREATMGSIPWPVYPFRFIVFLSGSVTFLAVVEYTVRSTRASK